MDELLKGHRTSKVMTVFAEWKVVKGLPPMRFELV